MCGKTVVFPVSFLIDGDFVGTIVVGLIGDCDGDFVDKVGNFVGDVVGSVVGDAHDACNANPAATEQLELPLLKQDEKSCSLVQLRLSKNEAFPCTQFRATLIICTPLKETLTWGGTFAHKIPSLWKLMELPVQFVAFG